MQKNDLKIETEVPVKIYYDDTVVGENIVLNKVITDKNVQIKHKNELSGSDEFPIYVKKNGVL